MSEADKPTMLSLEKTDDVISTLDKPATCSGTNLLEEQSYQSDRSTTRFVNESVDPVEEPDVYWSTLSQWQKPKNATASFSPAEIATLVTVIQEMRSSNDNLLERVIHLEQALVECQNDLQSYKQRSRAAESMLTQKVQDLASAEERVQFLSHELKTAHHIEQHQQTLVEDLTTRLATSQERLAQMERECALTQANYNEKFHQLVQTENSCRELRTRLIRQQRYTMQLKFALEKCLETPHRSQQCQTEQFSVWTATVGSEPAQSLFPKAEPITPWSAPTPSCSDELESSWTEASSSDCMGRFNQFDYETADNFVEPACTVVSSNKQTLDDEQWTTEPYSCCTQDIDMAEEPDWQDLFNLSWLDVETEEETANTLEDLLKNNFVSAPDIPSQPQNLPNQTEQFQPVESPEPNTRASKASPDWPSPVVYPGQPSRGRKSLSAIELPTFARK